MIDVANSEDEFNKTTVSTFKEKLALKCPELKGRLIQSSLLITKLFLTWILNAFFVRSKISLFLIRCEVKNNVHQHPASGHRHFRHAQDRAPLHRLCDHPVARWRRIYSKVKRAESLKSQTKETFTHVFYILLFVWENSGAYKINCTYVYIYIICIYKTQSTATILGKFRCCFISILFQIFMYNTQYYIIQEEEQKLFYTAIGIINCIIMTDK